MAGNGQDGGRKRPAERIGILGGSFNPIHAGHIGLALRAARELRLDKVLVVPAHVSPFKAGGAPERGFTDEERWDMTVRACAPHAPLLEPCRIELDRGGVSYAIDTVRALKALHPGAELFFIGGDDIAASLPMWKDHAELAKLCTFAIFPRTRESSTLVRRRLAEGGNADELMPECLRGEMK